MILKSCVWYMCHIKSEHFQKRFFVAFFFVSAEVVLKLSVFMIPLHLTIIEYPHELLSVWVISSDTTILEIKSRHFKIQEHKLFHYMSEQLTCIIVSINSCHVAYEKFHCALEREWVKKANSVMVFQWQLFDLTDPWKRLGELLI